MCREYALDNVAAMLARVDPTLRGVALRGSAGTRPTTYEDHRDAAPDGENGARLRTLHGEALPREVVITKHGICFAVALYAAQKTGLFLDQHENWRFVEGLAAGRTVLNCFAYTGGLLATASCATQVGPEAFREALAAAGDIADRRLQIIHEAGQPFDHPAPAHFPEGRHLKFVVGRVEERA